MKTFKLLIAACFLFISNSAFGQWYTNGLYMVYTYDRVGIGESSPDFTLDVNHGYGNESYQRNGFMLKNNTNSYQDWRMYVSNNLGDLQMFADGQFRARLDDYNGYWYSASDQRLKKNITNLTGQIEKLMQLRPTSYEMITDEEKDAGKKVIGFMAQELMEVYPQVVGDEGEGEEKIFFSVSYAQLVPALVAGIQEQQLTIEEQTAQIESNKAEIEALRAAVEELKGETPSTTTIKAGSLGQNVPNPVSGMTTISYHLSEGIGFAEIMISDAMGRKVRNISINQGNRGVVELNTADFPAGVYNYSLMVDGRIAETKRMVIK